MIYITASALFFSLVVITLHKQREMAKARVLAEEERRRRLQQMQNQQRPY